MQPNNDKYINKTLLEGLEILKTLLEKTTPFRLYSIADLLLIFPDIDYQKLYRTIKTFEKIGFIQEVGDKYRLSEYIYLLSHKFFKALQDEHERIKDTINKFEI